MNNITVYLFLSTNIVFFILGFIVSKYISTEKFTQINDMVSVKSKTENRNKTAIEIDDTKYVSKINTGGLEKKYDSLGDVKKTDQSISSSVNKLKNLKG
jgi:hypothetical protein